MKYFFTKTAIDLPNDRWRIAIVEGHFTDCQDHGDIICAFSEDQEPAPEVAAAMVAGLERMDGVMRKEETARGGRAFLQGLVDLGLTGDEARELSRHWMEFRDPVGGG